MNDGPEWFAPKRYGLGAGLPIAWQGWAELLIYLLVIGAAVWEWGEHSLPTLSIVVPATVSLGIIGFKTTRGGWRWRWGEDE
jgi:hypothetical protein